ncbi:copper resistance CopC family protein [Deinococcus arenicola]|uniref:Copper resistance protein CopC n=1 Tax=Deinococcus arenicola TaxID=2994950 RepID=A0ABU4DQ24_9DEIO|nr:copper resistance protein CopC [Deinococcus sp. ZS9-10]MDV6374000.1 copper resistance protein CopC [Deinococcus sp. ZS9-10]
MRVVPILLALAFGSASAHTAVTSMTPAADATVSAPKELVLKFNEPVELRFSTFRVLALKSGQAADDGAQAALALKADATELANTPLIARNLAAQLRIPLKSNLKAGSYVVAWKILSEDGHPVTGHNVFMVK